MTGNLKALGLALVAIFAIGAVAASAASAQGMFTSDGPATLIGENTAGAPEAENALTEFGFTVTCPKVVYTGHEVGSTSIGITNGDTSATITPHYGLCNINPGGFRETIDMNGCDFVFHLEGTTEGIEDNYFVKVTVVCPEGSHITFTIFTNEADHKAGKHFCDLTITENPAGYTGLKATDTTNNIIDIAGTIEGIVAHKKVGPDGGILCPTATKENGVLHVDVELEDKNGTEIGLSD